MTKTMKTPGGIVKNNGVVFTDPAIHYPCNIHDVLGFTGGGTKIVAVPVGKRNHKGCSGYIVHPEHVIDVLADTE